MHREVEPEILDGLAPADARAVRSRTDLRRLNALLGHRRILERALDRRPTPPASGTTSMRWVELGAGDGSLLLSLARQWSARGLTAQVTLVDRLDTVSAETRRGFAALRWSLECVTADVLAWLEGANPVADVMFANLFLHHFPDASLARLLQAIAARTHRFVACEPRRARFGLACSRLLGLLGCNDVTRHDAVVSVRAGFTGKEVSALWPTAGAWDLEEHSVGGWSHSFVAQRRG